MEPTEIDRLREQIQKVQESLRQEVGTIRDQMRDHNSDSIHKVAYLQGWSGELEKRLDRIENQLDSLLFALLPGLPLADSLRIRKGERAPDSSSQPTSPPVDPKS
jgi:seryl-tRNA synthetase